MKKGENCCCRAKAFCPALVAPNNIHAFAWPWILTPISASCFLEATHPDFPLSILQTPFRIPHLGPCLDLPLREFTYCSSFPTVTWVSSMITGIRHSPFPWVHPIIPNVCPVLKFRPISMTHSLSHVPGAVFPSFSSLTRMTTSWRMSSSVSKDLYFSLELPISHIS